MPLHHPHPDPRASKIFAICSSLLDSGNPNSREAKVISPLSSKTMHPLQFSTLLLAAIKAAVVPNRNLVSTLVQYTIFVPTVFAPPVTREPSASMMVKASAAERTMALAAITMFVEVISFPPQPGHRPFLFHLSIQSMIGSFVSTLACTGTSTISPFRTLRTLSAENFIVASPGMHPVTANARTPSINTLQSRDPRRGVAASPLARHSGCLGQGLYGNLSMQFPLIVGVVIRTAIHTARLTISR